MIGATVEVVAVTGTGLVRAGNQDALLVGDWISQAPRERPVMLHADLARPLVVAVADGMGGHRAGDLASRLVLADIAAVQETWTDASTVAAGLCQVNERLYEVGSRSPRTEGMGTTVAGVVLGGAGALCFNVGDSRVYRITDGFLEQLSIDDATVGRNGRPTGTVTQAFGSSRPITPHVTELKTPTASRLMLCTDGITGPVEPAALRKICREPDSRRLAEALVRAAGRAGAPDNISVIVVDIVTRRRLPARPRRRPRPRLLSARRLRG